MLVFKCMRVCVYVSVLAPMCACVCLFGKCFFSGGRGVEKYTSLSYIEHIPWIFLDVLCISLIGEYVRSMLHQNQRYLYIRVFPKVTHYFRVYRSCRGFCMLTPIV